MNPEDDDDKNPHVSLNMIPQEVLKTEEFDLDAAHQNLPVLVVPNDRKVVNLAAHLKEYESIAAAPTRRRGTYVAASIESFIAWLKANAPDTAPVFAAGPEKSGMNWKEPKISFVGIANYSNYSGNNEAAWHDLRATYDFPVSTTWTEWTKRDGVWQKQEEFAHFIEDRIWELAVPRAGEELSETVTRFLEASALDSRAARAATPSELYKLSRDLEANTETKYTSKINLQTGERTLVHSTENSGAGGLPLVVPNMFYIRIAPFFGMAEHLIGVRLRYRIQGGTVVWQTTLFAPDRIVRDIFDEGVEILEHSAGFTVYLGTVDSPKL